MKNIFIQCFFIRAYFLLTANFICAQGENNIINKGYQFVEILEKKRKSPTNTTIQHRPNIILINADDLGYGDVGIYGHPLIKTPHLDRLARNGQQWTAFYSAAALCTPSRAGLLTGRLPIRSGMANSSPGVLHPESLGGLPQSEVTLAEKLKGVGYFTACVGKWHLGSQFNYLPQQHGFDYFYGIPYSNDMNRIPIEWKNWKRFVSDYKTNQKGSLNFNNYHVPLLEGNDTIEQPAYQPTLTKRYTEKVIELIKNQHDTPFFLYVAYTMPHIPLFRSKNFENISKGGIYGDVIEEIDWSIGRIIKQLKKSNLIDNTLIIFTSDNGPWLVFDNHGGTTGGFRGQKSTGFEGGSRVPGIFYWRGTIQPAVIDDIGSALDLFPTLANLASFSLDSSIVYDGFDLSASLIEGKSSHRDELFYYVGDQLVAYRYRAYKLHVKTHELNDFGGRKVTNELLLFDLNKDPFEQVNLADKYPKRVERLLRRMQAHEKGIEKVENQLIK